MSDEQAILWSLVNGGLIAACVWGFLEIRSINTHLDVILGSLNARVNKLENKK